RFEDSEASALKLRIPILVLAWFMADGVLPAQNQTVVLTTKARLDFEKVDAEPIPAVADTMTCVQSHAAALPVTRLEERYLIHYRRGYCELFGAILTGNSDSFQAAARDFTEAIADWPKKLPARPPAGLRALIPIARLEQGRMADSYPELP